MLYEMYKFIEMQNIPRLSQEEIENLNGSRITRRLNQQYKLKQQYKILQQRKTLDLMALVVNSTKHLKN